MCYNVFTHYTLMHYTCITDYVNIWKVAFCFEQVSEKCYVMNVFFILFAKSMAISVLIIQ